jgi:uncharacterized repeat protein (TIGR02543 family)
MKRACFSNTIKHEDNSCEFHPTLKINYLRMKTKLLTLIILFIWVNSLIAQDFTVHTSVNTSTAICNNNVFAILQDKNGIMWFGTEFGVSSYNGTHWKSYSTADGLIDNKIRAIYEDKEGNIWLGSYNGVSKFDGNTFINYPTISANVITTDSLNNLWFGGFDGVYRFDGTTWLHYTIDNGLSYHDVTNILSDENGIMWFNTIDGISRLEGSTWSTYFKLGFSSGISGAFIDREGNKWFGTKNGLKKFVNNTWTTYNITNSPGLASNAIKSINGDSAGNIWVGTDKGISKYNGNSWSVVTDANGPVNCMVNAICFDNQGMQWVGTNRGVFTCNNNNWANISNNGLLNNGINCFTEDALGHIWISGGDGLSTFDGKTWKNYIAPDVNTFNANTLIFDKSDTLWIASQNGVFKFKNGKWFPVLSPMLSGATINSMNIDKNNTKWFATDGGVFSFDDTKWTKYTAKSGGLLNNNVYAIAIDKNNNKWFGTESGLSKFDGISWTNLSGIVGRSSNPIRGIAIDTAGSVWYSESGNSDIFKYDGGKITRYNPGNSDCREIAVGANNEVLVATSNGASYFDGAKWNNLNVITTFFSWGRGVFIDKSNNKWVAFYDRVLQLHSFNVKYKSNSGSTLPGVVLTTKSPLAEPTKLEKSGFTFTGWYCDSTFMQKWDFSTSIVTSDTCLYAKWDTIPQGNFVVSFNTNGGNKIYDVAVISNSKLISPVMPVKAGNSFVGWFIDTLFVNACNFQTDLVTTDTTLHAKWSVNSYAIHFEADGAAEIPDIVVASNSVIVMPANPKREGYIFKGWVTIDGNIITNWINRSITENTTLYAQWEMKMVTASFLVDGTSKLVDIICPYGTNISEPFVSAKAGYQFNGWYKEAGYLNSWNFSTDVVTKNMVLYGRWNNPTSNNNQSATNFTFFPNPAISTLQLQNLPQNAQITLLTVEGKFILQQTALERQTTIDVSCLPNGMYLLKVNSKEGQMGGQFIKQ